MQSIHRRLQRLESNRVARSSEWCTACGAYIGKHPTDIEIAPPETPPCPQCGQPFHVELRLGRGRNIRTVEDEQELAATLEPLDDEE